MEWIVVTGPTVEEARERALDVLSVAVEDADVEVLAEPTRSHWGLRRHPARVRARVRPVGPPPRIGDQRRNRRRKGRSGGGQQRDQKARRQQPQPRKRR